jgi:hypothetical protein
MVASEKMSGGVQRTQPTAPSLVMGAGTAMIHNMISQRAYSIWQSRGCPAGTALQDWLRAETEVNAEILRARGSRPVDRR